MKVLVHKVQRAKGGRGNKGETTTHETIIAVVNNDDESVAKAICKAMNEAGGLGKGTIGVADLKSYNSLEEVQAELEAKAAEVAAASRDALAKKLNRLTDEERRALAHELGVDVSQIKAIKTDEQPQPKGKGKTEKTEAAEPEPATA